MIKLLAEFHFFPEFVTFSNKKQFWFIPLLHTHTHTFSAWHKKKGKKEEKGKREKQRSFSVFKNHTLFVLYLFKLEDLNLYENIP